MTLPNRGAPFLHPVVAHGRCKKSCIQDSARRRAAPAGRRRARRASAALPFLPGPEELARPRRPDARGPVGPRDDHRFDGAPRDATLREARRAAAMSHAQWAPRSVRVVPPRLDRLFRARRRRRRRPEPISKYTSSLPSSGQRIDDRVVKRSAKLGPSALARRRQRIGARRRRPGRRGRRGRLCAPGQRDRASGSGRAGRRPRVASERNAVRLAPDEPVLRLARRSYGSRARARASVDGPARLAPGDAAPRARSRGRSEVRLAPV